MNSLFDFISMEVVTSIGWTIFHSLWQGCIVTLLLLVALYSIKSKDAQIKAFLSTSAMFILLFAAVVSFSAEYKSAKKQAIIRKAAIEKIMASNILEITPNTEKTNADMGFITAAINKAQRYFTTNIPLIVAVWSVGFFFFFVRFFGGVIGTSKLRKSIVTIDEKYWINRIDHLCKKINLEKRVGFAESALIKVPLVLGYFKPVVLFPMGLVTGLPQDQIEAIISHEIAHIKRYDVLINFIQSFAEVIFFFNPFVWFISNKIRTERENCCDDIAINLSGDSVTYAKALANVQSFKESNEPLFAIPLFKNQNQLLRRIKRMLQKDQNQNGFKEKFAAALIFIGVLVVAALLKNVNPAPSGYDDNTNKAGFKFPSSIFVGDKELTGIEIDTVKSVKGKRSFSYFQKENGKMKKFTAKLKNGKLTDLTIDGEKVAESKLDRYKDDVEEAYAKIDEEEGFSRRGRRITFNGDHFDTGSFNRDMEELGRELANSFNSEEFKEGMKEFAEGMKDFGKEFAKSFNSDEFKREMKEFGKEMESYGRDINRHYDSGDYKKSRSKFKKEMEKLQHKLRNRAHDEDFDSEEFEDKMDKLSDEIDRKMDNLDLNLNINGRGIGHLAGLESLKALKNLNHFDFGMKNFDKSMKNFDFNMKGFNAGMKKFGEKMKVFGAYITEVKDLLIDEKIIDEDEKDISLKINEDGIYVDNKKLSDSIFQKVKKIYKKHYNKEFSEDSHFEINN